MWTTIFAYMLGLAGFVTIAVGLAGLLILLAEKTVRIPLRYYGSAIGLMSGGLGLVGLAQVLRLLLVIVGKG
jgi:hypothetical protein